MRVRAILHHHCCSVCDSSMHHQVESTLVHACIFDEMHASARAHMRACVCARARAHIYVHSHTQMLTCISSKAHTYSAICRLPRCSLLSAKKMQYLGAATPCLQMQQTTRLFPACSPPHPRLLCSSKPRPALSHSSRDSHVSAAHLPSHTQRHQQSALFGGSRGKRCGGVVVPSASSDGAGGEPAADTIPEWEKALAAGAGQITNLFPL